MAEQRGPQVHHHVLADPLHDLVVEVAEPEARQQHGEVEHRDAVEVAEVAMADAVVDRLHGEERPGELHERVEQHDQPRERHLRAVGAQVPEQPPHQAVVVAAAEDLVVRAHEASSSSSSCWRRYSSA